MLLLVISYLVAVNECYSETPKADNFVLDVVVVVIIVVVVVVIAIVVVVVHPRNFCLKLS